MLADPLIDRTISRWHILSQVGEGGMATVYRAESADDGKIVALKIISPKIANRTDFQARFKREARLMASLDHPHISPVYDFGLQGDRIYLVMRLLEGGSLSDLIRKAAIPFSESVRLVEQIGSALDYAHERGIVHRDLKPANVLMDLEGNAYLTDFGIAKWREETTGLTATGMIMGTPGYMAPEQWRTEPVDPRTDVYALGVMVFEMLSGRLPFTAETPFSLMYRHLDEPPPAITRVNVRVPKTVDPIICRAMAKIPDRRYPSAGALALTLREALDVLSMSQSAPSTASAEQATYVPEERSRPDDNEPDGIDQTFVLAGDVEVYPVTGETLEDTCVSEVAIYDDLAEADRDAHYGRIHDSIDVGARTLLARAREAARETQGETAALAAAVAAYVEDLREQVKRVPQPARGPYKALESYDIADHRLFFGREKAIDALLARSPFSKLTILHAESGAGKTSLIRAGIIPRLLAGGFLPLYVAVRRTPPHEAIKRVLLPDYTAAPGLADAPLAVYLKTILRVVGPNREIFIFVDQFETFFTDVFTDEQRAEFINELAECLDDPLLPVRITLAMRTEYFGLVANFQPAIPQPFEKEFLLRPLTPSEAKRALSLPALRQDYSYQTDVVDEILRDLAIARGEISPPQLQLVGSALIESLPAGRTTITLNDYNHSGRAAGVLQNYLERLLERLPGRDRRLARVIVESLVREDQTRDIRTADSLRAELEILHIPADHLDDVLHALRENHVLRLVEIDGEPAYELVHDYLAMQVQLDPETIARKAAQELLDRRVKDYQRYESLLTRQELSVILAQRGQLRLTDMAQTLLARSQSAQRRQRRIALSVSSIAILGVIGVLAISLFAASQESQNRQERLQSAQTAEARVKAQRDVAMLTESRMLADLAEQQLSVDPVASLNLGIRALTPPDRPYVPEAEFALSRAVQSSNERVYMLSEKRVYGTAWNADESRVLTWSDDHTARVFDAVSGEQVLLLADHESAVITAAWSPDGSRILTGDYAGTARIWDAETGTLQNALAGHTGHLNGAILDASGQHILTWSDDGTACLWDAANGERIAVLAGHTAAVLTASWSPDERRIVTVGADYDARIWDAGTGQEITRLHGHANTIRGAIWAPDGTNIVTFGDDAQVHIWDVESGKMEFLLEAHNDRVTAAAWRSDGLRLASTGYDGLLVIWDTVTGQELQRAILDTVVDGVQWSRDGRRLLVFGEPEAVGVWNAESGENILRFSGHADTVLGAIWSQNEAYVLTYSQDGTARVWDSTTGEQLAQMAGHAVSLTGAQWSTDGNRVLTSGVDGSARIWAFIEHGVCVGYGEFQHFETPDHENGQALNAVWTAGETQVVTAYQDGRLRIWDVETGQPIRYLSGHTDQVTLLAWSPDGTRLLSGSIDGTARIWNVDTGENLVVLRHEMAVVWIAWSTDGSFILAGSEDQTARVWDSASGQEILRLTGHTGTVASAIWNRAETRILTASNDGTVRIWNAGSGQSQHEIRVSDWPLLGAAWSHDERYILVWGWDNMAHIYDSRSWQEQTRLQGHNDWVTSAAWSANDTQVLTSSSDMTVRLWDAVMGIELQRFKGHTDSVLGALWNRDGSRILTWSADGTARVWDVVAGQEILRLTGHTARVWTAIWSADETLVLTTSQDGTSRVWYAWPNVAALLTTAIMQQTRPLNEVQVEEFFLSEAQSAPAPVIP